MKKSERLKTCLAGRQAKIKIKFKYFILAHILTLFFVLASFSFAADNSFDFNAENGYEEPFSKLVEFLNGKKNELEKIIVKGSDFSKAEKPRSQNSKPELNNNYVKRYLETISVEFLPNLSAGPAVSSLMSAVSESVKEIAVDKPKQYFETFFCVAKNFVFPGICRNKLESQKELSDGSALPANENGAEETTVLNLKQRYEEAINESIVLSQKFSLLQNEMEKIKAGGVIVRQPVIEQRTVEKTVERIISGLSQGDLDSGLSFLKTELDNLNTNLTNQINNLSSNTSRQTSAAFQAISLTNKIDSLSGTRLTNIAVSGVSGLTDADIPDTITASNYLPLIGGTISGDLTVVGNATLGVITLQNATAGYFTATSTSQASTFPYASTTALTVSGSAYIGSLNGPLQANNGLVSATTSIGVQYGGTGQTSFGQGWLNSNGTDLSASTSPTVNYITATSTTATSTFPYLSVTTNSNLGTVVGGTWQGTAVGATYGGTGQNFSASSGLVNFYSGTASTIATSSLGLLTTNVAEGTNLYWTNDRFDTRLSATTTLPNLTTLLGLTNATTTGITSTNSWLGTIRSGVWNGTAISNQYGGTGIDSSALTGLAQIVAGTWSASSTLSTAFGGTGWNNIQANSILLGNGAGRIATTSAGTDGYVLGLSAGVPTWLATSTLSTITGTLAVAKGGTGQTSFGQGWLNSNGTDLSASTSPTVNYITATSTTATSTFPYLSVTTNSNLGTVVGGTWQGTAVGDAYLTKSGDWTGTLDTYNGSDLLARANHTGTQGVSTLSNYDWTFSNNYGVVNLTGSTTKPIWAQGGINASSTSNFVYASTTALTISGSAYIGSLNGPLQANNGLVSATTSIGVQYGGTGQTSFGQGWLHSDGTTFTSSTSPTVAYITATSTTATSTFAGGMNVAGTAGLTVLQNGNVGIGTTSPYAKLSVVGETVSSYFTATSTTATSTFPYLSVTTNSNLGTVVGGTWNGTAISNQYGGTGLNSSALTGLAQIVSGTWSASSTLSAAYGGTGATTLTGLLQGNGASAITGVAGTAGQFPYYNGTDTLLATSSLFLATSGNVGIGTTNPGALFHIVSSGVGGGVHALVENTNADPYGPNLQLKKTSTSPANGDVIGYLTYRGLDSGAGVNDFGTIRVDSDDVTATSEDSSFHFSNFVAGTETEVMTINTGKVGIGETSPAEPLHIKTTAGAAGIRIESTSASTIGPSLTLDHNSASPAAEDSVGRLYWTGRRADGNSYWTSYIDSVWTDPATLVGTSRLAFHVRNGDTDTTAMTIDHNGNLGIGTTSPTELFSVAGRMYIGGAGTSTVENNLYVMNTLRAAKSYVGDLIFGNNFKFTESDPILTGSNALYLQNQSGSDLLTINENGNVGIGTTTPAYKLHVMGDVAATSFVNISTETAKKDISYVSSSQEESFLDKIKNVKVAQYRYKIEDENSPLRLGLIAEEAPSEVLSMDGKGVDIYKMASFTLAGMKALQGEIEKMKLDIISLQAGVAASGGTGSDGLFAWILGKFNGSGITFEYNAIKVKNVEAEKVAANDFEMKDKGTGEIYCVNILNGEWNKVKGVCGAPASASSSSSSEASSSSSETSSSSSSSSSSSESSSSSSSETSSSSSEAASSSSAAESSSSSSSEAGSSSVSSSSISSSSSVAN